ncbi:hypothetical protein ACHAWC_006223 [Mediolabrus comicus]
MNLTVKTLKGGKFTIEIDPTQTIAQTKSIIENTKSELGSASSMKLIHSGKVLKDDDTIESCNIKPSDFLVVMITKAKKEKASAPAPAATAAASATETTTTTATSSTETATAAPPAATATAATTSTTAESTSTENNNSNNNNDEFPAEIMANLRALGFPESDILVCLRASNGNPDVAVEFLMNGIPPGIAAAAGGAAGGGGGASGGAASNNNSSSTAGATTAAGGGGPLEALRQHPQFNDIRRLVQTNPQMLSAVLQQIGGQQPELLSAINANQSEFLAMMNEPIAEGTGSGGGGSGGGGGATSGGGGGAEAAGSPASGGALGAGLGGVPGMEALGNPAQLAAMLQSMPPQEQQAMASMMGMTVDQLQQTAQMISAMPPEQVQQYMNMAMQGAGGMGGMMGAMGGAGGGGGGGGAQVLRLSEEEMAAVNRLTEMGFDRAAAAQAYLACDKNEALAANLLMDGGFADFGDDADMGGGGGGDDDMYD